MTKINFKYLNPFNKAKSVEEQGTLHDLENLRNAATREIEGAVYHYFIASRKVLNEPFENNITYQEYFAHEAADEMIHYLQEMRMISKLDSVQKQEFIEHSLKPYLVEDKYPPINFWYGPYRYPKEEREARWLKTIEHVVESIAFELETINYYQKYIAESANPEVKKLLTEIMNHEKGDLADFNKMFLKLFGSEKK